MVAFISPSGILSMWDRPNTAVTVVPFPGSDSMRKLPPVLSAAYLKKGIPNPTFRVVRVVKNGSVTRETCSGVIPQPLSAITMVSVSSAWLAATRISTRVAPARVEFSDTSSTFKEISGSIGLVVLCQDAGHVIWSEPSVYFSIYHHNRCQAAGAHTAAGVQREFPVRCTFTVGDAQNFFQFLENFSRSFYIAGGAKT